MIGVLHQLVRWTRRAGEINFYPALADLVSPVQNIILLTAHFSTFVVPLLSNFGQAVVLGCLSLCLYTRQPGELVFLTFPRFKPTALTYAMKELCLREEMEGMDKMVFE